MFYTDKKEIIKKIIKSSKLYNNSENILDRVVDDIYKKSSFIFEVAQSENEIFNYLISLVDASILKVKGETKGLDNNSMKDNLDSLYSVDDPKTLAFDITDESMYLRRLLIKLYNLDLKFPNKNYASIFYDRYVQKLKNETIAHAYNISEDELNSRLLDIVKFINKEKDGLNF